MDECQQHKLTQHAPSRKMECDYLYGWIKKMVTCAKKYHQRSSWEHRKRRKIQATCLLFKLCKEGIFVEQLALLYSRSWHTRICKTFSPYTIKSPLANGSPLTILQVRQILDKFWWLGLHALLLLLVRQMETPVSLMKVAVHRRPPRLP